MSRKYGRSKPRGIVPFKRILVVCEGAKTEPNYFTGLRRSFLVDKKLLRIEGKGYEPLTLVNYAHELVQEAKAEKQIFEEAWCVFDRDDHPKFSEACLRAESKGIRVAYSNPSFELWYLIHFQDQFAHIHRDDVIRVLKNEGYLPGYEKNDADIYGSIITGQPAAFKRAAELRSMHNRDGVSQNTNPSTSVDRVVESLIDAFNKAMKPEP